MIITLSLQNWVKIMDSFGFATGICHWSNMPITLVTFVGTYESRENNPTLKLSSTPPPPSAIALYAIVVKQWLVTVVFWYSCHGVNLISFRSREMISLLFPRDLRHLSSMSFISAKQFRVSILNKFVLGVDREAMLTHFFQQSSNRLSTLLSNSRVYIYIFIYGA